MAYGVIYKITNLVNGKVYIGQTARSFRERYRAAGTGAERVLKCLLRDKDAGRYYNEHLLRAIERYGCEQFDTIEAFDTADTKEELDLLEKKYIAQYHATDPNHGYNREDGGSHGKPCEETVEKMREHLLTNNPFKGKHHTAETRAHLSEMKKGKMMGENNPNYGRKWSAEKRKALSDAKKGVPSPMKGKKVAEWVRLKK